MKTKSMAGPFKKMRLIYDSGCFWFNWTGNDLSRPSTPDAFGPIHYREGTHRLRPEMVAVKTV